MKIDQYSGYLKRLSVLLPLLSLGGCNMVLFDPKGQIGVDEKSLIITCTLLMLLVVVPVIVMTLAFAWKYRASNTKARSGTGLGLYSSRQLLAYHGGTLDLLANEGGGTTAVARVPLLRETAEPAQLEEIAN